MSPFTAHGEHGGGFDVSLREERTGYACLLITGPDPAGSFAQEAGGHRWQRVPPTERSDRIHSSTVTVAVMAVDLRPMAQIRPDDLEIHTCRGSGPGGQHRNKTESAVEVFHRPSGLRVRCDRGRSQHQNRREALEILGERLRATGANAAHADANALRRDQIGTGERADKIRTVHVQHDVVRDHRTGQTITVRAWLKGDLSGLLPR